MPISANTQAKINFYRILANELAKIKTYLISVNRLANIQQSGKIPTDSEE